MKFALKPYIEILKQKEEDREAALAPTRANETQKQVELKIAQLGSAIVTAQSRVAQYATTYPLNVDYVMQSLDQLALVERQKAQLEDICAQLFPEEK